MPSVDPQGPTGQVRHSHSQSMSLSYDQSRALVPMWDSSDPERAPPPLPLNPQSPSVSPSKAGTSKAIQSAHAALAEKARENAPLPSLTKRMTEPGPPSSPTPERALVTRPSPHKRMQSLQPGSVRDMSLMIEGSGRSTPKTSTDRSTRPSTPTAASEAPRESTPMSNRENRDTGTPTPASSSLTPVMRPTARRPQSSILGENTPPQSATMLALQNMPMSIPSMPSMPAGPPPLKDLDIPAPFGPLAPVTNQSQALTRHNPSNDQISGQILSLTSIATSLQKEMSQLSRRSRDNATDLMSLKEATHARDEDIRKTLRELVSNIDHRPSKDYHHHGGLYPDAKPTSPRSIRPTISLPRIPSPSSFVNGIDRESSVATPSLIGSESSPATMALLEKIIREMGTKDGQDSLVDQLANLAESLTGIASANRMEELVQLIQQLRTEQHANHHQAMIPAASGGQGGGGGGGGNNFYRSRSAGSDDSGDDRTRHTMSDLGWNQNGALSQRVGRLLQNSGQAPRPSSARGADVLNGDVIQLIQSVKDSVSQGGGMTAEVKALVRELRGEVLGMGRQIARQLDDMDGTPKLEGGSGRQEEMARIVEDGLEQMKDQMHELMREHRRASTATNASAVDYQEIYNAMTAALSDSKTEQPDLCRDDVINAVKDAWEAYKPEIQVEQIGLERDEILACLQEGLQDYTPGQSSGSGATRDEVLEAVVEGLKNFPPPKVDSAASLSRDEIIEAIRDCLEEFEFPVAPGGGDLTRDDMVDAVQQGLKSFDFPQSNNALVSQASDNGPVVERLHEMMQFLKDEFYAVSQEAKQNVAANGRDTEQVLDATKDGFEELRTHIESYVDRASGIAGNDELMGSLVASFDSFRDEIADLMSNASQSSRAMLKEEIESLRDTVNSSLVPHVPSPAAGDNREVLAAIREGLERVRQDLMRPHAGTTDILDALHEGFSDLRASVERMGDKPADLTANDEILDAFKEGLGGVRSDIDALRETGNDRALATVGDEAPANSAIIPADMLKQDDIKNLEVMMTQLRIKVEAMEESSPGGGEGAGGLSKDDLADLESTINNIQESVSSLSVGQLEEKIQNLQVSVEGFSVAELEEKIATLQASVEGNSVAEIGDKITSLQGSVEGFSVAELEEKIATLQASVEGNSVAELSDKLASLQSAVENNTMGEIGETITSLQASVEKFSNAEIDEKLLDLQATVSSLSNVGLEESINKLTEALENLPTRARDGEPLLNPEDTATKEDVQAIETILMNMKARVEESCDGEQAVRKDHIDNVEALVLESKDSLNTVTGQLETVTRKEDLQALESLITQVNAAMDEMKERAEKSLEDPEKVSKTDMDAIEAKVVEIKDLVEKLGSTDLATLASKDDVKSVEDIVKEIKEAHASQAEANSQALVARDAENADVGSRVTEVGGHVTEVKAFLEEFQGLVKEKLEAGSTGIEGLGNTLESFSEILGKNADVGSDIKEMLEVMRTEVEESKAGVVLFKAESDEKHQNTTDTLATKIDEKIGELFAKYEAFENMMEERTKAGESRDQNMETAVGDTKTIAEELKSLVDTLGSTVTDSLEKMEEASKTVFDKVGVMYDKTEGNHEENKNEHSMTRDEVKNAITSIEVLQGHCSEFQPQILDSIKDVLLMVGEHIEASKATVTDVKLAIEEAKPEPLILPPPPEKYDDTEVQTKLDKLVEDKYDDTDVKARLDQLVEGIYNDSEVKSKLDVIIEGKYDDAQVLEKLEQVIEGKYDDSQVVAKLDDIIANKYDDAQVVEKLNSIIEGKYDDTQVVAKLDEIIGGKYDDAPVVAKLDEIIEGKYDETNVVTKLDQIIENKYDDAHVVARLDDLVENKLPESKYDDTQVVAKLDEIIGGKYDDAHVVARLDDLVENKLPESKYNDAEVLLKLEQIVEGKYDDAHVLARLDDLMENKLPESKYDDTQINGKLDQIVEAKYDDTELRGMVQKVLEEKYDDTEVKNKLEAIFERCDTIETQAKLELLLEKSDQPDLHSKLDKLAADSEAAKAAHAQLETIDKVHAQVIATAAEVSSFLAAQKEKAATENEEREKALRETTIALECQKFEKQQVETSISNLRDEESQIRESVRILKAEQEALTKQKMRLTGDVSSLETALRIRRDELHLMDVRAEGLERRILDGVLDHSRALLMAKSQGHGSKGGRDAAMSRKRDPRARTSLGPIDANNNTPPQTRQPHPRHAVNMAVSNRASPSPASSGRRILSLSQISNNTPTGGLGRSHSVRTPAGAGGMRKSSWAPGRSGAGKGYGDLDKENDVEAVREGDDEDAAAAAVSVAATPDPEPENNQQVMDPAAASDDDDDEEDEDGDGASTPRRSSMGTTVITGAEESEEEEDDDDASEADDAPSEAPPADAESVANPDPGEEA